MFIRRPVHYASVFICCVCMHLCVQTPEDWSDRVGKAGLPAQPQPLPISEEVVSACLYTITKEIVDLDHTHNNTISKEDFRMMCDRHFMRLTCDQVS